MYYSKRFASIAQRLADRSVADPSGCRLWIGATDSHGYGQLKIKGKKKLAARLSYAEAYGPIPKGLLVLHRCDTPRCIEPTCLFLGTHKTNRDDCVAKGRQGRCGRASPNYPVL